MSDAGDGFGLTFDYTTRAVAAIFASAIFSFIVVFICIVYRITNEILIARRCIMWARISLIPIFVTHCVLMGMENKVPSGVALPTLGIVRPAIGVILVFLGFFVSSHPIFRWLVIVSQPLYIVSSVYAAAGYRVHITCWRAGTCIRNSGYMLEDYLQLEAANYAAAFFELWFFLITAYLLAVMGACKPRYPVRLFSVTKPLSTIPAAKPAGNVLGMTAAGREHAAAAHGEAPDDVKNVSV